MINNNDINTFNSCNYITKFNKKCKNIIPNNIISQKINIINNKLYCTRHFNYIKKNENDKLNEKLNNKLNENDKIINILNKYNINYSQIIYLNTGTFLEVFKIIDKYNNTYVLKYQNIKSNNINMLYYEYLLLYNHLNTCDNIIKLYNPLTNNNNKINSYLLKKNEYAILFTEYIEETLTNKMKNYNFTIDDIKKIGIQLINIIKYIHSKKYLYNDLKPDNIMISNLKIKLIDFNLCEKYLDIYSNFYSNNKINKRIGNDIYSSRNLNYSYRGVRIDDLESILYILSDLLQIPEFIKIKSQKDIDNIIKLKEEFINNKTKYNFINKFIDLLNIYIPQIDENLSNRFINYQLFIDILNE